MGAREAELGYGVRKAWYERVVLVVVVVVAELLAFDGGRGC